MIPQSLRPTTADAEDCLLLIADTPELRDQVFRLRHQIYCIEHEYEPGESGREFDEYDTNARHILLVHRSSGEPIGTTRVVLPSKRDGLTSLPMAQACGAGLLEGLPSATTGEVSRFAISKHRRLSCKAGAKVRLGLMKGLFQVSLEMGLTHWCAIMEPTLQRLLRFSAIHFKSLGGPVYFHGWRQPVYASIADAFESVRLDQPEMWHWATEGGMRAPEREELVA